MNFHLEKLKKQLMNVANRVRFHPPRSTEMYSTGLQQLVPSSHRRAGRAYFAACLHRRRGYIALLAPLDYLRLTTSKPEDTIETYDELEEQWLRGLTWKPFPVNIKQGADGWAVSKPFHSDSIVRAAFLHNKGQRVVRVQLYPDSEATYEGVTELSKTGVLSKHGKHRIPLIGVKVTL